jgi:hypothetical protein
VMNLPYYMMDDEDLEAKIAKAYSEVEDQK